MLCANLAVVALSGFLLLGTGCAAHYSPLKDNELGSATLCVWHVIHVPTHCIYDKTRYTIDKETFEELYKEFERVKRELYEKRKI